MGEIIVKTVTSKCEIIFLILSICIVTALIIAFIFLYIEGQETLRQLKDWRVKQW